MAGMGEGPGRLALLAGIPDGLSEEEAAEFREELWKTFVHRSGVSAAFLAGIGLFLLVAVNVLDVFGFEAAERGVTLVVHLTMVVTGAAHLLLHVFSARQEEPPAFATLRARAVAFWFVSFLVCDAMFLLGLLYADTAAPFVVGTFVFGVALKLPGLKGLVLPALNTVAFLVVAALLAPPDRHAAHFLPVIGGAAATWLLGRMELETRGRDAWARLTIQHQARELSEARERLSRHVEELESLHHAQNEILGIAAHDLKNPLGCVVAYAELLVEEPEPPAEQRSTIAGRIIGLGRRMQALIGDLLDVNRIEAGKIECHIEELSLSAAAAQVVDTLRRQAESKGQSIRLEGGDRPFLVLADRAKVAQVLENLLSNAVKFSPPGAEILGRLSNGDGRVLFEVVDQGPGLTAEEIRMVFDPFSRIGKRGTAGEPSTGLGLSIVKRLCEAMSGRAGCRSEPGRGSTFFVELPLVPGPKFRSGMHAAIPAASAQ